VQYCTVISFGLSLDRASQDLVSGGLLHRTRLCNFFFFIQSRMTRGLARNQLSILAAAGCAVATLAVSYYLFASKRTERLKHDRSESPPPPSERTLDARTPQIKNSSRVMGDESDVPAVPGSPDKKSALHSTIEQLDMKGKALFKNKQVRGDMQTGSSLSITFSLVSPSSGSIY